MLQKSIYDIIFKTVYFERKVISVLEKKSKDKKDKKIKKDKKEKTLKVVKNTKTKTKYILISILLLLVLSGIYLGISIASWQNLALDMIKNQESIVLDTDENVIANIGSEKNRKNIDFENIPEDLIDAYISIEDQRFYSHKGVDIKRTGAAILNYITKKFSTFGGSTITQQLVKNLTDDRENSISRKVSEWFRAFTLEMVI